MKNGRRAVVEDSDNVLVVCTSRPSRRATVVKPQLVAPVEQDDAFEHHMNEFNQDLEEEAVAAGAPLDDLAQREEELEQFVAPPPVAQSLRQPGQPTEEEYEQHSLTHAEYRDWCRHCVQARARENKHVVPVDQARTPNVISVDLCLCG